MTIISKNTYTLRDEEFVEFKVSINDDKNVYVNMAKVDYEDKIPFEDAEYWIYTKSVVEMLDNNVDLEEIENYYYKTSDEESKELYEICINY